MKCYHRKKLLITQDDGSSLQIHTAIAHINIQLSEIAKDENRWTSDSIGFCNNS